MSGLPLRRLAARAAGWAELAGRAGPVATARHALEARADGLGPDVVDAAYRRIWEGAAAELGADVRPIGAGWLEIRRGDAVTRLRRSRVALDLAVTLDLALDKEIGQRLVAEAGLPVPAHVVLGQASREQVDALLARPGGAVVKPADGFAGRGVTCGVCARAELATAARRAAGFGSRVLVEERVPGVNLRLLLLDGELVDVIVRHPPHVTGDGRSTIAELVRAENRRRAAAGGEAGLALLDLDLDVVLCLRRAGRTLRDVPAAGERVQVRTSVGGNAARENETVRDGVAPALVAEASAAAAALGVRLAGVDVITPDPSLGLAEAGGAINEVNTTPALHHHLLVADPDRATPVAVHVLRRLLAGPDEYRGRGARAARPGVPRRRRAPVVLDPAAGRAP